MLCHRCNQNEADYCFHVHQMNQISEVHLCAHCLEIVKAYISAHADITKDMSSAQQDHPIAMLLQTMQNNALAALLPFAALGENDPPPRAKGEDSFPADAGEDVKQRRYLNELRAKLRKAVEEEDFEHAAMFRDQIIGCEKGVCIYDT